MEEMAVNGRLSTNEEEKTSETVSPSKASTLRAVRIMPDLRVTNGLHFAAGEFRLRGTEAVRRETGGVLLTLMRIR